MKIHTLEEIKKVIKNLKLKKSSSCILHSSITNIGLIKNVETKKIPENIVKLILKIIGPNGTLSVMTPYYDYGLKNKVFDIQKSPSAKELGAVSKYVLSVKKSYRSTNPLFNISSIGKKARYITSGDSPVAFGKDSAWDRLFNLNTKIIFIGCDMTVCTFVRYMEFRYGVSYLYNKIFNQKIISNKKIISYYSSSPLRYEYLPLIYDVKKFENLLKKKKVLNYGLNKNLKALSVNMKPCFTYGIEALKKNPHFFLRKKPKYNKMLIPIK